MAAQNLSQTTQFFFYGQTTTGRNFASRTKNEKDSENIYKNGVSIAEFFRNLDFSKKSYDAHFIYIYISRIFLVFCFSCKIGTGSGPVAKKKRICLREILRRHFVFKKCIKFFFMYPNTCRNMYAKPNFNIFIHFPLIKSIK